MYLYEVNQKFWNALRNAGTKSQRSTNYTQAIIDEFKETKAEGWKMILNKLRPNDLQKVVTVFQKFAKQCITVGTKRCKRLLPGGLLHSIFHDLNFASNFEKMPSTNDLSERCFGVLKYILKNNPNILLSRADILARSKMNTTFDWFDGLYETDKEAAIAI